MLIGCGKGSVLLYCRTFETAEVNQGKVTECAEDKGILLVVLLFSFPLTPPLFNH